ncbi:MAG: hypothetical protein D6782_07885 [Alphaproteobacteria bacterium]|nr:MAG: hypothetical protein D6782_07885 [Alphaproteobacteria bacterium]
MKRYDQLIRARKWGLDGLRRELGELEAMRAEIEGQIARLDRALVEEQLLAVRAGMLADYGAYASAAQHRRRAYEESLRALATQIAAKHDEVKAGFQSLKTIEVAAERMAERTRQARLRREQAALDEIAITRHQRQAL